MKNDEVTIDKIIEKAKQNNPNCNEELIRKAYKYANESHENQERVSGEKYIIHPLNVAYILAELEMDDSTIAAALLHDVVEDTPITHEDIAHEFGDEIAEMVEGVTKLRKNWIYFSRRTTSRKLQKNVFSNGKRHKSYSYKTSR